MSEPDYYKAVAHVCLFTAAWATLMMAGTAAFVALLWRKVARLSPAADEQTDPADREDTW